MGLTTWADAPEGKIKKSDVTVAKNYLSQDEMKQLNRMVTAYLDFAENMTLRHIPLTMQDWEKRLNSFIEMFDYGILQDAGKVSAEIAKLHAETEFEKYRVIQDRLFMSDFDTPYPPERRPSGLFSHSRRSPGHSRFFYHRHSSTRQREYGNPYFLPDE